MDREADDVISIVGGVLQVVLTEGGAGGTLGSVDNSDGLGLSENMEKV